jgi:glycosyltransferase involved in cell wall biosynthesis
MITREFPPNSGGLGYYVYYLAKTLIKRGHKVYVITRARSMQTKIESTCGIKIFRVSYLPIYPFHIWFHGLYVNRLLKSLESKLDIVHLHSPLPPPVKTSLPTIVTFHSPCKRAFQKAYRDAFDIRSLAEQLQSMLLYPFVESQILKISNKITAVSPNVRDELAAYGLDPQRITIVENAVDNNYFVPPTSKSTTNPYVLFVGILRSGKGVLDLVDIAKYVCEKRPDVRFLVCGIGHLSDSLKLKAQNFGLLRNFEFLGYVDRERILKLYQNAALLVQPSAHEGLSTVVLEAMSCGLPVVAYDIPGNSQVISSGTNGILVPPKSHKSMAHSILELLNNDTQRKQIGKIARRTITERYSWDKISDKMITCYESLLKNETSKTSFS